MTGYASWKNDDVMQSDMLWTRCGPDIRSPVSGKFTGEFIGRFTGNSCAGKSMDNSGTVDCVFTSAGCTGESVLWYFSGVGSGTGTCSWASYQIRKIASCACAGNAGNVFPACRLVIPTCITAHAWRTCSDVCWDRWLALFIRSWWRGKGSRNSQRMRNRNFMYLVRGP